MSINTFCGSTASCANKWGDERIMQHHFVLCKKSSSSTLYGMNINNMFLSR